MINVIKTELKCMLVLFHLLTDLDFKILDKFKNSILKMGDQTNKKSHKKQ